MTKKLVSFTCWDCQREITVRVTVERPLATQSQDIPHKYPCRYCGKSNKVYVPDNIDVYEFILGRDKGFLGYTPSGTPILQGEEDV